MKKYIVVYDEQGGSFGMGRAYTANEWLEQAIEWLDQDDYWEDDERNRFIKHWEGELAKGNEDDLITMVSCNWDLEFETIDEDTQELYEEYLKEWQETHEDPMFEGMEPADLAEWYMNEYQEIKDEYETYTQEYYKQSEAKIRNSRLLDLAEWYAENYS